MAAMSDALVYKPNPKHKRGVQGDGPPRWYPDRDSLCPDDMDIETAQALLENSILGEESAASGGSARYALFEGQFFKAYMTETESHSEIWHGFPVRRSLVKRQVPARVLRHFVERGELQRSEYKKLLGGAR